MFISLQKLIKGKNSGLIRKIWFFRPKPLSKLSELIGKLKGQSPEYEDVVKTIVKNCGRELTRTETIGNVEIKFANHFSNFDKYGFDIGNN